MILILLFLHMPFLTVGANSFFVGCRNQDDPYLGNHHSYNRSIGVYHRNRDNKFCSDKSVGYHSTGPCKNFYAHCNDEHVLSIIKCPRDKIHGGDHDCVDLASQPQCYHVQYAQDHATCVQEPAKELVALEDCSREYGICFGGNIYNVQCRAETEAFSRDYGGCVPKNEHPDCKTENRILNLTRLSSMCAVESENEYEMYLGSCNRKYLSCAKGGYALVVECDPGQVADGSSGACVPIAQSPSCPVNWRPDHARQVDFVQHMNTVLESSRYCLEKPNGLFFDPYDPCRREAIFCFQSRGTFHLCPLGSGIDQRGWCAPNRACLSNDFDYEVQRGDSWKSNFLTLMAADARLCHENEIDGTHVFGFCQRFYARCHLGRMELHNCHHVEEIFDVESNRCLIPDVGHLCSSDRHRSIDQLIDQSDGRLIDQPDDRLIDQSDDRFSPNDNSHERCKERNSHQKPIPIGKCRPTYGLCVNGWDHRLQCSNPDENAFSESHQNCIPKTDNPECPEFLPTTKSSSAEKEDLKCEGDGGFLVYEKDCTKYYRCAHGRKVEMSCGEGTAWDPEITGCNHKEKVSRCNF